MKNAVQLVLRKLNSMLSSSSNTKMTRFKLGLNLDIVGGADTPRKECIRAEEDYLKL